MLIFLLFVSAGVLFGDAFSPWVIADILPSGVILNVPAFTWGRDQLNQEETDETARIAAVRIHVERVIGWIKNYP